MLDLMRQEIAYAVRALGRRPGFTALVAATLALGIGANTAIFTVVDAVLLKPLPYGDPQSLVMIWSRWDAFEKTWVSSGEFLDYRDHLETLDDAAAFYSGSSSSLTGDFEPQSLPAAFVSANFFDVFGVEPAAGRAFTAEEDLPNGPAVVMIDEGLWREVYDADPAVLGATIEIDRTPRTVVGVVPSSFRVPIEFGSAARTRLYLPLGLDTAEADRGGHWLYVAGRLAPDRTAAEASSELQVMTERWTAEGLYPEAMQFTAFAVPVEEEVAGGMRDSLAVLFAAVGFLLLIACANVAALWLTRAEARHREIVVRQALGAGRGRIFRTLLVESLLLAVVGGTAGLGLAFGVVRLLPALAPEGLPRMTELDVDWKVLAFTLLVSVLTGLLFGTLPAFLASRPDLASSLRDDSRGGEGRGRQRVRSLLVLAEVSVAVMLLVGAGLMIRSFAKLRAIDPGFDAGDVLAVDFSLPEADYEEGDSVIAFYDELRHRVEALPGVERAAHVRVLPLATTIGDAGVRIEGRPRDPNGRNPKGDWQVASPGYFETMGIRLAAGRFFNETDRAASLPVAVINERMAEAYWPGEDPVGRRIRVGGEENWRTIVGVAGNLRHNGIDGEIKTKFYVPDAQFGAVFGVRRSMTLVARTSVDPLSLAAQVRAEVARLDPNLPLTNVRTLDDVLGVAVARPRFVMWLMGSFSALALLLAAVGIYGVLSFMVGRRTREIGIRMALGADRGRIRSLVLGQGLALTLAGTALGLLGAFWAAKLMESLLYGVEARDLLTFGATAATLLPVALFAVLWPARRATRIDPVQALHYE